VILYAMNRCLKDFLKIKRVARSVGLTSESLCLTNYGLLHFTLQTQPWAWFRVLVLSLITYYAQKFPPHYPPKYDEETSSSSSSMCSVWLLRCLLYVAYLCLRIWATFDGSIPMVRRFTGLAQYGNSTTRRRDRICPMPLRDCEPKFQRRR
jgi:hypothetical protein